MPNRYELEAQVVKYKKIQDRQVSDKYLEWALGHHRRIAEIVENLTEEKDLVLDDGCGNRLHWITIRNREMVGVDLDASWNRKTRELPIEGHFLLADGCHLPFIDKIFSLVISINVLEHVQKKKRTMYLDEMKRVAKRYYLSCPHSFSFIHSILYRRLGTSLRNKEHLFWKLPSPTSLHGYFNDKEFLYTKNPRYRILIDFLRTIGILKFLYPYIRIRGPTTNSSRALKSPVTPRVRA